MQGLRIPTMQEIQPTPNAVYENVSQPTRLRQRFVGALLLVLLVLILAIIPPLFSINRFQRRIASGISESLGRPVHWDHVSLNLLPLPSLTIENLAVEEDPEFGSEPTIRSSSVTARLRVSSLWRRQVEFSRISFLDPSINLVHASDGRWNIENVLLRAAKMEAAPTDQKQAGTSPRFPYIEATGARINLKLNQEKLPISLTEADFALWLPRPDQWQLRLKARPLRTDTNVSDPGTVEIEATLGRPAILGQVPLSVQGAWRHVPMGEASRFVLGRDAGLRGDLSITLNVDGTIANSALKSTVHIDDLRRSDFVPEHTITVDAECQAQATLQYHAFEAIRCGWPIAGAASTLAFTGSIPNVRRLTESNFQVGTSGLDASTLLAWLRVVSARVPPGVVAAGRLSGTLSRDSANSPSGPWQGSASLPRLSISGPPIRSAPITFIDLLLEILPPTNQDATLPVILLRPVQVELGGKDPALLEGQIDTSGVHLRFAGMAMPDRLLELAACFPQFGEGLESVVPPNQINGAVRMDLTGDRPWGGPQVWTKTAAATGRPVQGLRLVSPLAGSRRAQARPNRARR